MIYCYIYYYHTIILSYIISYYILIQVYKRKKRKLNYKIKEIRNKKVRKQLSITNELLTGCDM